MSTSIRERPWLEELYRTHRAAVWAYAARRVRPDEADDIVSEVFVTAWRSRERVPDEPLPWLYRTAANHVLHAQRGEARRGRLAARVGVEVDGPAGDPGASTAGAWGTVGAGIDSEVAERLDARARVHSMLATLSPDDAELLRLSAWEGLDPTAIAEVLDCSAGTARVRLHRARRRAERVLRRLDEQAEAASSTIAPTATREACPSATSGEGTA